MNYYNDNDPKIAAWLRELIRAGLIPKGDVDERSILEVKPHEIYHYTQHHFFAGIAGWPLALQFAGWPDDEPVWTGSCPCQPLSCAGQRKGHADKRHLWPAFYALISECRPATIFGEQVAGPDGREWLAGVRTDLEGAGYAVGAADLCAAGVGAPHPRQRLYWVAQSRSQHARRGLCEPGEGIGAVDERASDPLGRSGLPSGMANAEQQGREGSVIARSSAPTGQVDGCSSACRLEHATGDGRQQRWAESGGRSTESRCDICGLGFANGSGRDEGEPSAETARHRNSTESAGSWSDFEIVHCLDGKTRRFEPGSFPLASRVPARVAKLRGLGNSIVPQVAAQFIMSAMESF